MADAVAKGTLASRLQMQRTAKLLLAAASAPREAELALRAPSIAERNSKLLGRPQSARSDPELLQKLLCFVNQELHHTDPHSSSYIDERLNVFRRAFGHFTAAYGAYAPLLDAVREAYESALQQARLRAAGVDALSERLALIQDEASRMIERLRDDAATQQAQMMATVEERETEVRAANRENELLRDEVKTLRSQLELKNRQLDDINLRNVELAKQVRSARRAVRVRARVHACPRSGLSMRGFALQVELWQAETADARRAASGEDGEISELRRGLKDFARREEILLSEDMETKQAFTALRTEHAQLQGSSVPRSQLKLSQEALSRCQTQLKATKAEAAELSRLLNGGESHQLFPNGLEWATESLAIDEFPCADLSPTVPHHPAHRAPLPLHRPPLLPPCLPIYPYAPISPLADMSTPAGVASGHTPSSRGSSTT